MLLLHSAMRNIETFSSKQMYLYLSLVERKAAEFYHNAWLKWLVFIAFSGQLMVSLSTFWEQFLTDIKFSTYTHNTLCHSFWPVKMLEVDVFKDRCYVVVTLSLLTCQDVRGRCFRESLSQVWGEGLTEGFPSFPAPLWDCETSSNRIWNLERKKHQKKKTTSKSRRTSSN